MAENPYLQLIEEPAQPDAPADTSANPYLEIAEAEPPPNPVENPYLAAVDFEAEKEGLPVDVDQPETPAWTSAQVEEAMRRAEDLGQRGMREANSWFYRAVQGAVSLLRQPAESVIEAGEADPTSPVFGLTSLLKKGADYLIENYGGTEEGAYDVVERQLARLAANEQAAADRIAPPEGIGEQAVSMAGGLPVQMGTYALAWETGGAVGMGALGAAEAEAEGRNPAVGAAKGLLEGAFFKWMESLVPAVPKNFSKEPRLLEPEDLQLNVNFEPPPVEPSFLTLPERAYTGALRQTFPVEKAGKVIGDLDIIQQARTNVGNIGNSKHFLEFGGFNPNTLEATGNPGLIEAVKGIPFKEQDAFKKYLIAKHSKDWEAQGLNSGQPKASVERIVAEGDANPAWQQAADTFWKFNDDVLKYARDSGLVSEEAYQTMRAKYPHYVPMQRAGFLEEGSGGGGFGQPNQPIKRAKGSERPVMDPFKTTVQQAVRIINEADKNRLANTITRWADDPRAQGLVRKTGRKAGKVESLDDLEALKPLETTPLNAADEGIPSNFKTFRVYEKGEAVEYAMDPDLADALGRYSLKSDGFMDKVVLNALSLPAKILRAGTTDNPAFVLKNVVRDQLTLPFQTTSGAKPGISFVDGLMSYIKRDEAYKLWIRGGGSQSTMVDMDRPAMRKVFRDMMSDKQAPLWREVLELGATPLRVLQEISKGMEAATRLGEFKAGIRNAGGGQFQQGALQRGLESASPQEIRGAAIGSRDVTTDFGLRGSSEVIRWWSKIEAFMNPRLQGLDRFVRLHRENPKKAALLGTLYLTIPTLALNGIQMQDEQYREKYRRLPNWRKTFFWNIDSRWLPEGSELRKMADEKANGLIPVPIPFEWGLAYKAAPEQVWNSFVLQDPKILQHLAQTIAGEALPPVNITDSGLTLNAGTVFRPLMDIRSNRKSFFDAPIHTEQELGLPKEMRFSENTARGAVLMSEWMKGYYSPKEIEHLIQSWTGGLGRSALEEVSKRLPAGPFGDVPSLRPLADDPVADFVFGGIVPRSAAQGSSQVVSDFWDEYNDAKKRANARKELGNRQQTQELIGTFDRSGADEARDGRILLMAEKIKELGRTKRQVARQKNIPENQKKKTMLMLNRRIDDLASLALGVPLLKEAQ